MIVYSYELDVVTLSTYSWSLIYVIDQLQKGVSFKNFFSWNFKSDLLTLLNDFND